MPRSIPWLGLTHGLLMLCSASYLGAQQPSSVFGTLALGVGFPTPASTARLDSRGFAGTVRVGRALTRHLATAAELSYQGLRVQPARVAILCPANADCAAPLSGSVSATTFGVALRGSLPLGGATLAFGVTPGWTWFSASPAHSRQSVPSLALNASALVGKVGPFRNLLEVRYQRSLSNRAVLRSALQLGLGIGWH